MCLKQIALQIVKLSIWSVLTVAVMQKKTPWWVKSQVILNLMSLGILHIANGQLLFNGIGIHLESQGKGKYIAGFFMTAMICQVVSSSINAWAMKRWREKTVLMWSVTLELMGPALLIIGIQHGNILFYFVSVTIIAFLGTQTLLACQLLLRQQLGKDHIVGTSSQKLVLAAAIALATFFAFQAPLIVWAWVMAGIGVLKLVMAIFVKPLAVESGDLTSEHLPNLFSISKEITAKSIQHIRWNWFPKWMRDPATRVSLGGFPALIGSYCFGKLLPLSSVFANPQQAGTILALISLTTGLLQFQLSRFVDQYRQFNNLVISFCHFFALIGLCLIWLEGWWIIIATMSWIMGLCSISLVSHTAYAVAHNNKLGNSLPTVTSNTAGVAGGFYIGYFEATAGYDAALGWLSLFTGASFVCSIFLWRVHKLPQK
ncbi:hypothetical protein SAMN05444392_101706 [Seinonella peptonophila]|uniref:Major Facilitator Superfamily protein n=1 Tax=Seinonella peptonophila TaxID=112248 RepID=A0A1M4TY75_9BACL|nr:hypothetical protein [Seinonella peptonophila]SHE49398.1 hypothetical protein SAMN05444392_101706 [Seinonella peptonophila]